MNSTVLEAVTVSEYLVYIGVRVDGLLQRLLVGMAKGELQRLVRVGLEERKLITDSSATLGKN